jgi:hypothetical protein
MLPWWISCRGGVKMNVEFEVPQQGSRWVSTHISAAPLKACVISCNDENEFVYSGLAYNSLAR